MNKLFCVLLTAIIACLLLPNIIFAQCDSIDIKVVDENTTPLDLPTSEFYNTDLGIYFVVRPDNEGDKLYYRDSSGLSILFDSDDTPSPSQSLRTIEEIGGKLLIQDEYSASLQSDLFLVDPTNGSVTFSGYTNSNFGNNNYQILFDSIFVYEENDTIKAIDPSGELSVLAADLSFVFRLIKPFEENGLLLIGSNDGVYMTDGTPSGTRLIDDEVRFSNEEEEAIVHNEEIYFLDDGELYKTDGTENSLVWLSESNNWPTAIGRLFSTPNGIVLVGSSDVTGRELWLYDNNGQVNLLMDFVPGSNSGLGLFDYYWANGRLFFTALDENNIKNFWVSDGTAEHTEVIYQNVGFFRGGKSDQEHTYVYMDLIDTGSRAFFYFHPDLAPQGVLNDLGSTLFDTDDYFILDRFLCGLSNGPTDVFLKIDGLNNNIDTVGEGIYNPRIWLRQDEYAIFSGSCNLLKLDLSSANEHQTNLLGQAVDCSTLVPGYVNNGNYTFLYELLEAGFSVGELNLSSFDLTQVQDIFPNTLGTTVPFQPFGQAFNHVFFYNQQDHIFMLQEGEDTLHPLNITMEFPQILAAFNEKVILFDHTLEDAYKIDLTSNELSLIDLGLNVEFGQISKGIELNQKIFFKRTRSHTAPPLARITEVVYLDVATDTLIPIISYIDSSFAWQNCSTDELVKIGDRIYFPWYAPETGVEVWSSDGTAIGTEIVFDVMPGNEDLKPNNLQSSASALVFNTFIDNMNSWLMIPGDTTINLNRNGTNSVDKFIELDDYFLIQSNYNLTSIEKNNIDQVTDLLSYPVSNLASSRFSGFLQLSQTKAVTLFESDQGWEMWTSQGTLENTEFIIQTITDNYTSPQLAIFNNSKIVYVAGGNGSYQLMAYDLEEETFQNILALDFFNNVEDTYPFTLGSVVYFWARHPLFWAELHYLQCAPISDSDLEVILFHDENGNEVFDPEEATVSNVPIQINELDTTIVFSSSTGRVNYPFLEGNTYELISLPTPCWTFAQTDSSVVFTVDTLVNQVLHIPLVSNNAPAQINTLLTSGPTRCSFTIPFWLNTRNTGCSAADMFTSLQLPPEVTIVSANQIYEAGANDNEFIFEHGELQPGQLAQVLLQLQMPNENFIGETIEILAISGPEGETLDTFTYQSTLTCAYDPNDKLVLPARPEPSMSNYTQFDEKLMYTVRFQNTGNDTAFTVRIEDQLSPRLDWASVRPIAASHPYSIQVDENGLLTALFENILLPDSSTNFVGSQGFVTIEVAMREDVADFSTIQNTAGIFFDFNAPIITNTVTNTAVEFLDFDQDGFFFWEECDDLDSLINPDATEIANNGIDEDCDGIDGPNSLREINQPEATIYPNPTNGQSKIALNDRWPLRVPYLLLSPTGKQLQQGVVSGREGFLDVHSLPAGIYYLQLYHQQNGRWLPFTIVRF